MSMSASALPRGISTSNKGMGTPKWLFIATVVCATTGDIASGAQTERHSGAGPVGGSLGGKDPTGRKAVPKAPG
jgi:hypothetical protein